MNRLAFRLWPSAIGSAVCLALAGWCLLVRSQEPASAPRPSAEQLQTWLAELDSDSYEVREVAAQRLAQAGPDAVDALSRGMVSESAEIAWRSGAALERIAVAGDEATLARITSILDGLSVKGKPGLRSMAAEMHVRQKQFRHDRAVASLKQNGAVLSTEGVELGGGPIFVGGGPIAIAVGDPFGAPAVIEAVPEADDAVPPPAEAPAAGSGILGLIGRLLGGAAKVEGEAAPPREAEAAPPLPVPPPAVAPSEKDAPSDVPLPAPEGAKLLEPAEAFDEFKEISRRPIAAPAEGGDPAPPPDIQVIEPPPALEGGVIADIEELGAPAMAMGFIGGGMIDVDEEESELSASLVLGPQWRGGNEGLKVLKDVPEIYSISLNGAKITDESLPYMAELPNLASLYVRHTNISRQGLMKLREQKPDLAIQARGEAIMGVNADLESSPLVLSSVFYDSGAYHAGLHDGDEICSVDGAAVKDFADLTIAIYGHKAGDKVRVEYQRAGAKKTVEVTLKKRADDQ